MSAKPFNIGLCMAGAVSAGAYTAGVMDYLLEALAEWEKRRGQPGVPSHEVKIPVMGGASAGGMTAILAASTINNSIIPVDLPTKDQLLTEHPENKLYHSWVDLTAADMFPKMLDTSDISNGKVISALNSKFIDEVANKMIASNLDNWMPTPAWFTLPNKLPVKLFTTLTNLEGFSYYAGLNASGRESKYYMSVHNDYACFELLDGIAEPTQSAWMPLDFQTGENLKTAKDAAMATGAFPIGLAPRVLEREAKYVKHIPWLSYVFNNTPLKNDVVTTLNVDGGVINNEPFEKVRDVLNEQVASDRGLPYVSDADKDKTDDVLTPLNCNYNTFENTVLMIDPFPSSEGEEYKISTQLPDVLSKTLSAMLSQMRAKPKAYKNAMMGNDASQFIISPSREIRDAQGNVIEELFVERAIACGALSGFGGFLSKEFRIHDYYLGRYNCEVFLRDYFTVPESALTQNPIFREGYTKADKSKHASGATKVGAEKQYQIIPIFTDKPSFKVPLFSCGENWPKITVKDIDRFDAPIRNRVQKILLNIAELKGFTHFLLYIGAKVVLNKMMAGKVMGIIKQSLTDWRLLDKK